MSQYPLPSHISVQLLDEHAVLTLDELCRACAAQSDLIAQLVDEGILTPLGVAAEAWTFTGVALRRARIALSLQRDLGVNLAGVALVLQLLEEIEALRAR